MNWILVSFLFLEYYKTEHFSFDINYLKGFVKLVSCEESDLFFVLGGEAGSRGTENKHKMVDLVLARITFK